MLSIELSGVDADEFERVVAWTRHFCARARNPLTRERFAFMAHVAEHVQRDTAQTLEGMMLEFRGPVDPRLSRDMRVHVQLCSVQRGTVQLQRTVVRQLHMQLDYVQTCTRVALAEIGREAGEPVMLLGPLQAHECDMPFYKFVCARTHRACGDVCAWGLTPDMLSGAVALYAALDVVCE